MGYEILARTGFLFSSLVSFHIYSEVSSSISLTSSVFSFHLWSINMNGNVEIFLLVALP
jgi:hypothetical protein